MYYCKEGDILVIAPERIEQLDRFWKQRGIIPYTSVLTCYTYERLEAVEGDYVIALEASMPPWYAADKIRCLYKGKPVHIRRVDLQHANKKATVAL